MNTPEVATWDEATSALKARWDLNGIGSSTAKIASVVLLSVSVIALIGPYLTEGRLFLMGGEGRFSDFTNAYWYFQAGSPEEIARVVADSSPAWLPLLTVGNLASSVLPSVNVAITLFTLSAVSAWGCFAWFSLPQRDPWNRFRDALILGVLSYGFLFAVDRGNFEWLSSLMIGIALVEYGRRPWLSAACVLLAVSVKPWAWVVVLVMLQERRWRQVALVISGYLLACLAVTWALHARLGNETDFSGDEGSLIDNLSAYFNVYVVGSGGHAYGHSLFGLVKTVHYALLGSVLSTGTLAAYFFLSVVSFVVLWISSARRIPVHYTLSILVLLTCLLPFVSADYRLLNVVAVLVLVARNRSSLGPFKVALPVVLGLSISPPIILETTRFTNDLSQFAPDMIPLGVSYTAITTPLLIVVAIGLTFRLGVWESASTAHSLKGVGHS